MDPVVAVRLMRTLAADADIGVPSQGTTASRVPAQWQPAAQPLPAAKPLFVATPAYASNQNWVLDKNLTLRDNIDAWSKQSGWNLVVWEAANFYQVTATTNLDGTFPGVLRQIADSTGLNICAKVREKYVRVTDSSVPCSK
jgi:hypothetical protein